MMKAKELKNLSLEELAKKLDELKKDLFMLRMQHATNQLDNPMQIAATATVGRAVTAVRAATVASVTETTTAEKEVTADADAQKSKVPQGTAWSYDRRCFPR